MAISSQQLTIYLYSAHRAVIFAIAQVSCNSVWIIDRGFSLLSTRIVLAVHSPVEFSIYTAFCGSLFP